MQHGLFRDPDRVRRLERPYHVARKRPDRSVRVPHGSGQRMRDGFSLDPRRLSPILQAGRVDLRRDLRADEHRGTGQRDPALLVERAVGAGGDQHALARQHGHPGRPFLLLHLLRRRGRDVELAPGPIRLFRQLRHRGELRRARAGGRRHSDLHPHAHAGPGVYDDNARLRQRQRGMDPQQLVRHVQF